MGELPRGKDCAPCILVSLCVALTCIGICVAIGVSVLQPSMIYCNDTAITCSMVRYTIISPTEIKTTVKMNETEVTRTYADCSQEEIVYWTHPTVNQYLTCHYVKWLPEDDNYYLREQVCPHNFAGGIAGVVITGILSVLFVVMTIFFILCAL